MTCLTLKLCCTRQLMMMEGQGNGVQGLYKRTMAVPAHVMHDM